MLFCRACAIFATMNVVKRLYDWVLSWSESKWGVLALFLIAFAESSFFPVPPDVLLIALCIGATKRSFYFAAICLLGSILGGVGGYGLGYFLWQTPSGEHTAIADFFFNHVFSEESFNQVAELYNKYNFWVIFTAGFTPLPYKIFTITGGLFHIDFIMFLIASIISRGLRFFLFAALIWKFGGPIKVFIDKYFNILAIAFTLLLIGSFVLVGYLV